MLCNKPPQNQEAWNYHIHFSHESAVRTGLRGDGMSALLQVSWAGRKLRAGVIFTHRADLCSRVAAKAGGQLRSQAVAGMTAHGCTISSYHGGWFSRASVHVLPKLYHNPDFALEVTQGHFSHSHRLTMSQRRGTLCF